MSRITLFLTLAMGLFGFLKKAESGPPESSETILGMILLEDAGSLNIKGVVDELKARWRLEVNDSDLSEDASVLSINGYSVAIAVIPAAIPGDEVRRAADYNYLWSNGAEESAAHSGHVILSIMRAGKDPVGENILFSQVASAILNHSRAIGIYIGGRSLVLKKDFYNENVAVMTREDLPLYIWIYFGLRTENGRHSVYTYGLTDFGKKEMEILNSSHSLEELNEMMFNLAHYVIAGNIRLKSGETIGLSAEQKLKIRESKGRYLDGSTLKIEY
jgi:hypothetical protein